MTDIPLAGPFQRPAAYARTGGRVTLRTLIWIRWVAIAGQLAAVMTVQYQLGFDLPLGSALAAIGASALLNLAASFQRWTRRLGDLQTACFLAFDILQLSTLLFLTGGIENPFATLILAPVAVAATILSGAAVAGLSGLALVCVTVLSLEHMPLPWSSERPVLPPLYVAAQWGALALSCIFIALYNRSVAGEARRISDALGATQDALAREQRVSALGALAAAAAHELGSPLSTIAVVAKELARDVPAGSALAEDVALIQSQSDRCREILADLARAPEANGGGTPFDSLQLGALIEAIASPHRVPGIALEIRSDDSSSASPPVVRRTPEIVHGIGNLLQNAMQFARSQVNVQLDWTADDVTVSIVDDGPGFPPSFLGRLGEPYLSSRRGEGEHLGLGIFIAQTLLDRTGADISFDNARNGGAVVVVRWRRTILETGL